MADPNKITVSDLAQKYLLWAGKYYARDGGSLTRSQYKTIEPILRRFAQDFGDRPVEAMHAGVLTGWIEDLADSGAFCRNHVNVHLKTIRATFRWGVQRRLCSATTLAEAQAVASIKAGRTNAKDNPPVQPVEFERVAATVSHISSRIMQSLIWSLWYCGARSGELVNARIDEIDQTDPGCWLFRPADHKNAHRGHARTIYLGPSCIAMIRPLVIGRAPEAYVWCATMSRAQWIFDQSMKRCQQPTASQRPGMQRTRTDYPSRPFLQPSVNYAIRKACVIAGVEHWHAHQLRHAAGTRIVTELGIEAGRVMLGHKDFRVLSRYAAPDVKVGMEVAKKLG